MEALDKLGEYNINSSTDYLLECILEKYESFLLRIDDLTPSKRQILLKTMKDAEIVNNQEMEHEDPFMVQLDLASSNGKKRTSIDVMCDSIINNQPLTIRKIEQLHRLLIRGSNDDVEKNYKIRDFDTYVAEVSNGVEKISYVPPAPKEIRPYLRNMFKFLSDTDSNKKNILLNSIIIHYYIAALQPFGNGNTRLARLMEYGSIFKLSIDMLDTKIKLPAIYASGRYLITRKQYRDSIANLATNPTDENFNNWVKYNLYMLDEQLNYNDSALTKKIQRGF